MKEIVVKIDDSAYRRVEEIASARKISVTALVEELVESATGNGQTNSQDVPRLTWKSLLLETPKLNLETFSGWEG